jgi:hypothetical protein
VGSGKLLLAALLVACLAGCGDDGSSGSTTSSPPPSLTARERAEADRGVAAVRRYCRRVAQHLAGRGSLPPIDPAVRGAQHIAGLARRKPEASYSGSQRARDLAADLAEDLEGTNCSQTLVAELARGL